MPRPTQDTGRLPPRASTGRPATGGYHLGLGVHFIAFAVIWKLLFFHGLGAALMICGVAGFVLAAIDAAVSAIDLVGGVLPGAILR